MTENGYANQGPSILVEIWVFFALTFFMLTLRLLSRRAANVGYWWDDYFIIISVLVSLVDGIICTMATAKYGLGKHIQVVGADSAVHVLKLFVAQEYCYITILTFTKLSILLYFWRIFKFGSLKWPIYFLATIVILWYLGSVILFAAQCHPLKAFWYPTEGDCLDRRATFLGNSIPNVITDFFLIITPIPFIWRLQMGPWQKLGLTLTFALGSLVTILSTVRLVFAIVRFDAGLDVTWTFVPLTKWSLAELYLAPCTACLPSIGPLLRIKTKSLTGGQSFHTPSSGENLTGGGGPTGYGPPRESGVGKVPTGRGFARLEDGSGVYGVELRELDV